MHADNMRDMCQKGRQPVLPQICQGERNGSAKFVDEDIRDIRAEYANSGITQTALARKHGVARRTIDRIIRRETWTHVG